MRLDAMFGTSARLLTYRESYGGEVANSSWLAQVSSKSSGDSLETIRTFAISRAHRRSMRLSDLPNRPNRAHITIQYPGYLGNVGLG